MLIYLDGYPLLLPCRYADRVACYDTVYIVTNIPLEQQYATVQAEQPETFNALLRRINYMWQLDKELEPKALAPRKIQTSLLVPTTENLPF